MVEKPARASAKPAAAGRKRSVRKPARPQPGADVSRHPQFLHTQPATTDPENDRASGLTPETGLASNAPARTRTIFWSIGAALLVLLLAAQATVFYGQDIGRRFPLLRDTLDLFCQALPCQRLAPVDMRRLDLVETQVAPHPRYDRVLRIKATIVNRAARAQPYPLLEVTLIDRQGHVVARRSYPPREYLRQPQQVADGLPPQLAVRIELDITSPGTRVSGFEVLLLPPDE